MKTVFLFALLAIAVAHIAADCVYSETNGEPQCTADNVNTKFFRNNWDPTHYWVCDTVGQPARSVECELSGYQESSKQCVDWSVWQWTEPCDPQNMVAN